VTGDSKPLPPRDPHPLSLHVLVDSAVAFLAILVLGLIFGLSLPLIVGIALVAGACLAPYTRRTEERQLADREREAHEPPGPDGGSA
jgi:hypothetical protein